METTFTRSPHLVSLVAQAERLATLLGDVTREQTAPLLDDAAVASVKMDGSPIKGAPTAEMLAAVPDPVDDSSTAFEAIVAEDDPEGRTGTWLDALGVVHRADDRLITLEWRGVRDALAADHLGRPLLTDPVPALRDLHAILTRGLVAADHAGRLRRSDLAVQDRSVGRVLYYPADPATIGQRLASLAAWLVGEGSREHPLVTSGILHLECLAIHPYESANGRLARTAARLVLRAGGLDPAGVAMPEVVLATDALGCHEEVARTLRRRDRTIWLERWAEAVVAGLREGGRRLGLLGTDLPARAADALDALPGAAFTIADFRALGLAPSSSDAATDLEALLDAGLVTLQPGTRGLRFSRSG